MKDLSINKNYLKFQLFNKYKKNTVTDNCKELGLAIERKLGEKLHWRTIYNHVNGITLRMSTIRSIAETLELDNNKIFYERFKIGD